MDIVVTSHGCVSAFQDTFMACVDKNADLYIPF